METAIKKPKPKPKPGKKVVKDKKLKLKLKLHQRTSDDGCTRIACHPMSTAPAQGAGMAGDQVWDFRVAWRHKSDPCWSDGWYVSCRGADYFSALNYGQPFRSKADAVAWLASGEAEYNKFKTRYKRERS